MNFTQNKPNHTKISLGDFRIVNGKLEEKILHIQHIKIAEAEPFCKEIWAEIKFNFSHLVFEPCPNGAMCIFCCVYARKISYKYGGYFIDGRGYVCGKVIIYLENGNVLTETIFVTSHGCRVRAV